MSPEKGRLFGVKASSRLGLRVSRSKLSGEISAPGRKIQDSVEGVGGLGFREVLGLGFGL